ncbi:MAG: hypothetical protein HFI87_05345 [Bacilli bacterium]|nr:hypothetical protein [Bacilli bacterium]
MFKGNKKGKLNNRGFAITSIIYSMLLLFIVLMTLVILTLSRKKTMLDKSKNETIDFLTDISRQYDYPEVNLSISSMGQLYLPKINDNNFTISGIEISYSLDLPGDNYTFDWVFGGGSGSLQFCNLNNVCTKIVGGKLLSPTSGTVTTTEPGRLSLGFEGVSISINNLLLDGKKVKINSDLAVNAPNFNIKSGCTNNSGSFTCANNHDSGATISGDVYIFAPNNGSFTQQYNIDGASEWVNGTNSANGYYIKISGSGKHVIKARTYWSNNDFYSKETDDIIFTIQ